MAPWLVFWLGFKKQDSTLFSQMRKNKWLLMVHDYFVSHLHFAVEKNN